MKDQEFSLKLYDLGIMKQLLVLARIKHINKMRIIVARSLTVRKGSYKYGKDEDWNEPCDVGLGLALEISVWIHDF